MIVCLGIIFYQQNGLVRKWLYHLHEEIVVNWKDTLKMSVPAIVYMIQNNLQYVAVSNLEAAVFQVLYIPVNFIALEMVEFFFSNFTEKHLYVQC